MSKHMQDDGAGSQSIPGFLTKTYEIFSSPEYEHICSWGPSGDTIIVKRIEDFSKTVLPKYFKHSNFQSFVRQLNMYDFHKTVQDPAHGEFQHAYFRKNRTDLLHLIKRKAHGRGSATETRKRSISAVQQQQDFRTESDQIMSELRQLRSKRDEIEKRLSDMEYKQSQLISENVMLKNLMGQYETKQEIMRSKMQKILYFMYDMYVNAMGMRNGGGQRRLDGAQSVPAIPSGPDQYGDVMRLFDIDMPTLTRRPSDVPTLEDNLRITEIDGDSGVTSHIPAVPTIDDPASLMTPIFAFDDVLPFSRVPSIEYHPHPLPTTTTSASVTSPVEILSSSATVTDASTLHPAEKVANPAHQMYPLTSQPLQRPDDSDVAYKKQRVDDTSSELKVETPPPALVSLHDDLLHFNQQHENVLTRIDSLDATLAQLMEGGDLDFEPDTFNDFHTHEPQEIDPK